MSAKPTHTYLKIPRKERRGTFVLFFIILLLCSIPFLYPLLSKKSISQQANIDSSLAHLQMRQTPTATKEKNYYDEDKRPYDHPSSASFNNTSKNKGELFYFDPNTVSEAGWKKLGLRDKTIATIVNYRNKGGKFKQPEDIKKIWGLFPDEAERLIPFVKIEATELHTETRNYSYAFSETKKYEPKKINAIDINSSDTSAWIDLPGIGTKLSQRIINFREKLGGFYSVNQVGETFGLPDSTFQKIKPYLQISGEVKKININTATVEELKSHPYIRYQLGNAIFQYRVQHGNYNAVADIKKIMIIDEAIYNKINPYIAVQ